MRWITTVGAALLLAAAGVAAQNPPAGGRGVRVEISVPASVRAEPVTGRVYVMISRTNDREPRLQIGRTGTPFFGRDVEKLRAGQAAIIDASDLGTPVASLKELPPGDYWVQGFVNIYSEFKRADGHTVWMHDDQWEGQHWNVSPGNLYSEPQRVRIDAATETIKLVANRTIPPVVVPPDTAWVKRIKIAESPAHQVLGPPDLSRRDRAAAARLRVVDREVPGPVSPGPFRPRRAAWLSRRQRHLSSLDARRLPADAGGHAAASESVLRRQLRCELGERRSVRRRDHAGADSRGRASAFGQSASRGRASPTADRPAAGSRSPIRSCIRTSTAASGPIVRIR